MSSEPRSDVAPDVVPLLAFAVLDFVEAATDEKLTMWQKRLLIDTYGPGPAGVEDDDG